ncbi:MAG: hypothetical protein NVS4B8_19110 [Herpetosiphon sp.]
MVDELRFGAEAIQHAYQNITAIPTDPEQLNYDRLRPSQIRDPESPDIYVQIRDLQDRIIARSPNLGTDALPLPPELIKPATERNAVTNITQVGKARVMSLVVPLRIGGTLAGVIQVAQTLRQLDRLLTALLATLLAGTALAALVALSSGMWLTRAMLRPIKQISATAARIGRSSDLHLRVTENHRRDEFGELASSINGLLARLQHYVVAQENFVADIAHELRTPLTAMSGNLEILRRGAIYDPVMLDESLRDLESEANRLSRLSNDLLLLAHADLGLKLHQTLFQVDELLLATYRYAHAIAERRQIRVDIAEPIPIMADRDRLQQALYNLIINAIAHTPNDGSIVLKLCSDADFVCISVADTGIGIPEAQQPFVFDRFYRGDAAQTVGAGLGLTIVKTVAEAHGGNVTLRSEPNGGTIFTIRLPAHSNTRAKPHQPQPATSSTPLTDRHVRH